MDYHPTYNDFVNYYVLEDVMTDVPLPIPLDTSKVKLIKKPEGIFPEHCYVNFLEDQPDGMTLACCKIEFHSAMKIALELFKANVVNYETLIKDRLIKDVHTWVIKQALNYLGVTRDELLAYCLEKKEEARDRYLGDLEWTVFSVPSEAQHEKIKQLEELNSNLRLELEKQKHTVLEAREKLDAIKQELINKGLATRWYDDNYVSHFTWNDNHEEIE
jgi:hypothetical protein